MIILKLMGGLGNQMFQYALGRRLAEDHHTEFKMDLTFLLDRTPRENFTFRNYDLNVFNIKENFIDTKELAELKLSQTGGYLSSIRKIFGSSPYNIVKEKYFHYDAEIIRYSCPVYLEGYWQSEKYFENIKNILRGDFTFRNPFDKHVNEMKNQILENNAVCVNFRRADYVSNPLMKQFYAECSFAYYNGAIDTIMQKVIKPHFFIFSDDINWCKDNVKLSQPTTYVTHEYAGNKFEHYLHLMSLCKHFIIPNSTFAWWGAWLSTYPGKTVIAPKRWFNDPSINTCDLIPSGWQQL